MLQRRRGPRELRALGIQIRDVGGGSPSPPEEEQGAIVSVLRSGTKRFRQPGWWRPRRLSKARDMVAGSSPAAPSEEEEPPPAGGEEQEVAAQPAADEGEEEPAADDVTVSVSVGAKGCQSPRARMHATCCTTCCRACRSSTKSNRPRRKWRPRSEVILTPKP